MRDAREVERAVGIADVHHDLHGNLRQRIELDFLVIEVELALVDETGVAFSARHGHVLPIPDGLESRHRSPRRPECPARAR